MGELSGQRLLPSFEKDLDVVRHDVLTKFDRIWCVESLTATRRNLVLQSPKMGISLDAPLALGGFFFPAVVVLWLPSTIECVQFVLLKKKFKKKGISLFKDCLDILLNGIIMKVPLLLNDHISFRPQLC